ncbi:MAG: response regulator [Coriobacteriales bacterium]|nr:response regulator [Coriobacteriales bacterium]
MSNTDGISPPEQPAAPSSPHNAKQLALENHQLAIQVRKLTRELERERVFSQRIRESVEAKRQFSEINYAERSRLELHMDLLLANSRDFILFFDAEGKAVFFTESFAQALGRGETLIIKGCSFAELLGGLLPAELVERINLSASSDYPGSAGPADGDQDHYEIQQSIDFSGCGRAREYVIEFSRMRDGQGNFAGSLVFFDDMTEFVEARREAERANAAKSDFLANVSHEIRTPMNAIIGLTDILEKTGLTARQLELIGKLRSSSTAMLALINDILDFSKIEAGKFELVEEYFDLLELLDGIKAVFELMMQQKSLYFSASISPELPRVVHADAKRLRQVLSNILSNAFKYTRAGSVELSVVPDCGDFIRFTITDTGIGIRPADLDKLFNEFEQLDRVRNKHVGGSGLGLAITRNLVEMMGGSISVQSTYGQGSCFSVRLLLPAGSLEDLPQTLPAPAPRFTVPEGRVLVVDDMEINLEIAEFMLEAFGLAVVKAHTGLEALELLEQDPDFDLLLMDHMMPVMDGIEATGHIRQLPWPTNRIPIIALTANAIAGNEQMFRQAGMDGFLSKPLNPDALAEVLYQHLPKEKLRATATD